MIAAIQELLQLAAAARDAKRFDMARDYTQAALELMGKANVTLKEIYKGEAK